MPEPLIKVVHQSGDRYVVSVHADCPTEHRVVVEPAVRERLAPGDVSAERLLEESFRFLLEREPNTSILPAFDLPVIGRYFPEFESSIVRRLTK